jgi:O-antigen/teichoic acid export membrane protein
METIKRIIPSRFFNHYINDWVVLFSGNSLKISLGFLLNMLLAKFFSPSDFGIYSTLMTISLISVNLTDFGYGNTLNRLTNLPNSDKKQILSAIFSLKTSFLIVFLLFFFIFSDVFTAGLRSLVGMEQTVRLLLVLIPAESYLKFLLSCLQANKDFRKLSRILVLSNVIRLSGVILLFWMGRLTFYVLLLLYAASSVFLILLHARGWKFDLHPSKILIRQINRYAVWVWLFIIANSFFVKSDILLANLFGYEKEIIGNYNLIFYFISLIGLLQETVFTQLLPKTSHFSGKNDFMAYFHETKYLRLGTVIFSALYVLLLPLFLNWMYSDRYVINYIMVIFLGLPFLFSMFNEFNVVLLYAFEKHMYIAIANAIGLICVVVGMLLFPDVKTIGHIVMAIVAGKFICDFVIFIKVRLCLRAL